MTEQSLPVPEHVDVVVVGAGLSGIGAAASLVREHPGRSYAVLEKQSESGGTWRLFRYPGVRSDSDMYTLGYGFKPWTAEKSLADGASILEYVRETAAEYGVADHIRFGHEVTEVAWDSGTATWTVRSQTTDGPRVLTCSFLWVCTGYYDTEQGYTPELSGLATFGGQVVHPQHWPEDLAWQGRNVVVIGSGATAVTLVPALAASGAAHVTMLQRTPTYILSRPAVDGLGVRLNRRLGARRAYRIIRRKNVLAQSASYRLFRRFPRAARRLIRRATAAQLPAGYPVDTHFNPPYDPWDQRLCLVPDGDLFRALADGAAEVVTDRIRTFTAAGVVLESGREIPADLLVTATGLSLQVFGNARVLVDGVEVRPAEAMAYRALMLSGVPNMAFVIGYTNASWTLKADLVGVFVNRVLHHMDAHGHRAVVPQADPSVAERPFMDFDAGYVRRAADLIPRAGDRDPWKLEQNYRHDRTTILAADLDDGVLRWS